MGLTNPPQVRVIYAECNAPDDGSQTSPFYLFDTFYDKAQADITAGRVAALAALGLEYDDVIGDFTALSPGVFTVYAQLNIDQTPGGACNVLLGTPDYLTSAQIAVANPNTLPTSILDRTFPLAVGEVFKLSSTCANGTDTPISYAALSIVRLV